MNAKLKTAECVDNYKLDNIVKPFVQSPLCLIPLMKLEKFRSSTKFDVNLDYFLFE